MHESDDLQAGRMRLLLQQIKVLLLGKLVISLLKFLIGVLTARFLGAEGKGVYVAYTRVANLWSHMFCFSLGEGMISISGAEGYRRQDVLGLALIYALICATIASIFFLIAAPFAARNIPNMGVILESPLILIVAINSLIFSIFLTKFFQSLRLFSGYNYLSIISLFLQLAFVSFGLLNWGSEVEPILTLYASAVFLGALVSLGICLSIAGMPTLRAVKDIWKATKFSLKLHALELPSLLENQIDVLILLSLGGAAQVGVYSVGVSLTQMSFYLVNAMNSALFPSLASWGEEASARAQATVALCRLSVFVFVCYIVLAVLFGQFAIVLIFGSPFANAYFVMLALIPGILGEICYRYMITWHKGENAVDILAPLGISTLVLNVALIPLLYAPFGIVGVALASSLTYTIRAAVLIWLFRRKTGLGLWDIFVVQKRDFDILRRKAR